MASEFYLEIVTKKGGKIKGESQSQACPEQIQVKKFAIGLHSPSDFDGQATGRVQLEHVEFEFYASIASTPLFQTLCSNDVIKTATLSCRKAGGQGKEQTFVQWRFKDARLVSYRMLGEHEEPVDSIKIAYAGVEISYKQQKRDGALAVSMLAAYDSGDNTMVTPTLT